MRAWLALPLSIPLVVACTCAAPSGPPLTSRTTAPGHGAEDEPLGTAPLVWVRLEGPNRRGTAHVRIDGEWTLRGPRGETLASGSGLDERVPLRTAGSLELAGKRFSAPPFVLSAGDAGDLRVGDRRYAGTMRLARTAEGRLQVQLVTTMDTYLEGVVHAEIPAQFPAEAQRAQAIVARTYALSTRRDRKGARIELSDSGGKDQEFHGVPSTRAAREIARDAVASTRGAVLFDGRRFLRAWYHSTCGDHTSPAEGVFPVPSSDTLGGVACGRCSASKYYRWRAELPGADVAAAAGLPAPLEEFRVLGRSRGGRAVSFLVRAGGRKRPVHANQYRLLLGPSRLRSTFVDEARLEGGTLVVEGRGWGHGVGLCQMGAKARADDGDAAEEILAVYYPGARLVRLW